MRNKNDKGDKVKKEKPRRERGAGKWSCCLNVLAVGGLLLAGGLTIAVQWGLGVYRSNVMSRASLSETDLNRWLGEPVVLSPEVAAVPPKQPADLLNKRDEYVEKLEDAWNKAGILREGEISGYGMMDPMMMGMEAGSGSTQTSSTYQKLISNQELDTTDTQRITSVTATMQDAVAALETLVSDPRYVYSNELNPDWHGKADHKSHVRYVLNRTADVQGPLIYAVILARDGKISSATEILAAVTTLTRHNPPETLYQIVPERVGAFAREISDLTSNPLELRRIVTVMEDARTTLVDVSNEVSYFKYGTLEVARAMVDDGFIPAMPVTRRDYCEVRVRFNEYLRRLRTQLPGTEARLDRMDFLDLSDYSYFTLATGLFGKLLSVATKDIQILEEGISVHREREEQLAGQVHTELMYDLSLVAMARRIAELEGLPFEKVDDVAPAILRTFPEDPYTSGGPGGKAGLRYDVSRRLFYSVGQDGVGGSKDDIYEDAVPAGLPEEEEFRGLI